MEACPIVYAVARASDSTEAGFSVGRCVQERCMWWRYSRSADWGCAVNQIADSLENLEWKDVNIEGR